MPQPAQIDAFAVCIQARLPVYGWGAPGIGKTTVGQLMSAAINERSFVVILSLREPSDQAGLPVIVREEDGTTRVELVPPRYARELLKLGKGAILWDEMNTAPVPVQNSALRVINENWLGDVYLGEEVSHGALGNPPQYSPGAGTLLPTMANRFCHIDWPFNAPEWASNMIAGEWPKQQVPRVPPHWREFIPSKRALVGTFIQHRPDLALNFPKELSKQGREWASPRTWERLAFALAAAEAAGYSIKSEVASVLARGWVGDNSTEFKTWAMNQDLPDPEAVLADPKTAPIPTRQDQLMAVLASVATAGVRPHDQVRKRYDAAWLYVARIAGPQGENRPDIAIPACRILAHHAPPGVDADPPREIDAILPILNKSGVKLSNTSRR